MGTWGRVPLVSLAHPLLHYSFIGARGLQGSAHRSWLCCERVKYSSCCPTVVGKEESGFKGNPACGWAASGRAPAECRPLLSTLAPFPPQPFQQPVASMAPSSTWTSYPSCVIVTRQSCSPCSFPKRGVLDRPGSCCSCILVHLAPLSGNKGMPNGSICHAHGDSARTITLLKRPCSSPECHSTPVENYWIRMNLLLLHCKSHLRVWANYTCSSFKIGLFVTASKVKVWATELIYVATGSYTHNRYTIRNVAWSWAAAPSPFKVVSSIHLPALNAVILI